MLGSSPLKSLLGSACRAALLETLVASPDSDWAVRAIAGAAGVDYKSAWTEMLRLASLGLVTPTGDARAKRYRWNRQHPAAGHVEGLVRELGAVGVVRILREHLQSADWLREAILYGSWASGLQGAASDVDILLVGSASGDVVHSYMEALERQLGRPIDYRLYSPSEFQALRSASTGFVPSVLSKPHMIIRAAA